MQLYVSGSLAFDRIMSFPGRFADHILPDKIHILNVSFVGNGLTERFGGTAGNIAYSLALLGEKPRVLASAGTDFDHYAARMAALGLPLDGVLRVGDELTANCHITTDMADNQITCFNPGAMNSPCGYAFNGADPADSLAIVSPGNFQDMVELPKFYKERGIPYIFDPGQNVIALSGEDLAQCIDGAYALITNDYELEIVVQRTGMSSDEICSHAKNCITTLGEKGSVVYEGNGCVTEVPPAKLEAVVDPTGAGDAYRAGLLKGLAMGLPLAKAAFVGSACAKWSVEKLGTQEHHFTQEEFWKAYEDSFGPLEA